MRLGKGEHRSGGRTKPRLLCSAFEACIAAVLLDAGPEAAEHTVRRLLLPWLQRLTPGERDYKTKVQEQTQARYGEAPRYSVVDERGPEHARQFLVRCEVNGETLGTGEGRSKLEAEQAAAEEALVSMSEDRAG
jgi:ribonuclease-3